MSETRIYCRLQFEALHRWDDAPEEVSFLRNDHRHLFHCRVEWEVDHNDRAREFIMERWRVAQVVNQIIEDDPDHRTWSCEMWAHAIMEACGATMVDVSEDGENGATVQR